MTTSDSPEPTSNDFRLVEEAIRRACASTPVPDHHRSLLRRTLTGEVQRGRRDLFSLVRSARKALDEI